MRNTLVLLSSLALAAAASAQSTATSSSSLIATYNLGAGVSFDGYTAYEYDSVPGSNSGGFDTDGGKMTVVLGGGTTHAHIDGSNLFTMGSFTSVAIDSPDYSAIDLDANPYGNSYLGYTYVMTFTAGAASGTVRFDMHAAQSLTGAAASP